MLSSSQHLSLVQGKYAEAEPLYKRAVTIETETYGRDHPEVASYFGHLGDVLKAQVRTIRLQQRLGCPNGSNITVIIVKNSRLMFAEVKQSPKQVRYGRCRARSARALPNPSARER